MDTLGKTLTCTHHACCVAAEKGAALLDACVGHRLHDHMAVCKCLLKVKLSQIQKIRCHVLMKD